MPAELPIPKDLKITAQKAPEVLELVIDSIKNIKSKKQKSIPGGALHFFLKMFPHPVLRNRMVVNNRGFSDEAFRMDRGCFGDVAGNPIDPFGAGWVIKVIDSPIFVYKHYLPPSCPMTKADLIEEQSKILKI